MKKEELQGLVDKIQSMSAKEIVLSMVDALRNPVIKVDVFSWGERKEGVCYGCAATNQILKISGFDPEKVLGEAEPIYSRFDFVDSNEVVNLKNTIRQFEMAINDLRKGNIFYYNIFAKKCGIKLLPEGHSLPYISNKYGEMELLKFEKFANTL